MNDILTKLALPFHPSRIIWKPGALNGKKDSALALAYADVRAYQNRLDEVCGMDWAVSYLPWGTDRIICHLTIDGITRSSTGEADSDSERSEIAGTAAESQAFKRACAMFGLGRYLYSMPSNWVDYDAERKQFTDKAKAKLQGIIAQHYQRAMAGVSESKQVGVEVGQPTQESAEQPKTAQPASAWDSILNATESDKALLTLLEEAGVELYGEQWPHVKRHNINRVTGNKPKTLTGAHVQTILGGLDKLKKQRNGVPVPV